ncbi:GGDEF domain-containing protein [Peterkaempfera griseoplana]|uniref:GGDEF domain-containing protein n=1 Tax=Peterkaempfera griseoplana TaxID=66896 RepID=UPI0006E3D6C4|nr:GGDEF domain-containing protein [Peterkaempfera griseoplana]
MSGEVLVRALALLSLPVTTAAATLAVAALRMRRRHRAAVERAAELQRRVLRLEKARSVLERTAVTDPLTGVGNYRHLQLTLDREVARHLRGGRPLAVLLLEVGGFEAIYAAHGRPRGHAALRDLAQRLAVEIRRSDALGRYGGEEFLVVLPDTGAEGAAQVAERLRWTVRRHLLQLPEHTAGRPAPDEAGNGLTATVGIAVLPVDGNHAATLLRAADRALAEARRAAADGSATAADGALTPTVDPDRAQLGVSAPQ